MPKRPTSRDSQPPQQQTSSGASPDEERKTHSPAAPDAAAAGSPPSCHEVSLRDGQTVVIDEDEEWSYIISADPCGFDDGSCLAAARGGHTPSQSPQRGAWPGGAREDLTLEPPLPQNESSDSEGDDESAVATAPHSVSPTPVVVVSVRQHDPYAGDVIGEPIFADTSLVDYFYDVPAAPSASSLNGWVPPMFPPVAPTKAFMCCYYKQGKPCKMGDQCWYSHSGPSDMPCHYGEKCRAGHKHLAAAAPAGFNPTTLAFPLQRMAPVAAVDHACLPSDATSCAPPLKRQPELTCRTCLRAGTVATQVFDRFVGGKRVPAMRAHCVECLATFCL